MKLSELIAAYGDDNVKFQNLDSCAHSLNYTSKRGTKITFGTDAALGPDGLKQLGLVVWMDRDKVDEIIKAQKASATDTKGP